MAPSVLRVAIAIAVAALMGNAHAQGKPVLTKEELANPNQELIDRLKNDPEYMNDVLEHYHKYFIEPELNHYQLSSAPSVLYDMAANENEKKDNLLKSMMKVYQHNNDETKSYKLAINKFSHLTDDEFVKYLNIRPLVRDPQAECSATSKKSKNLRNENVKKRDPPKSIDWRDAGAVTPVKNQGHCGSCWTFSTTGAIEAHWKKTTGVTLDLSEQQLIDCARDYDNHGCNGGLPSHAFEYIKAAGGIEPESAYPYKAADQPGCNFDKSKVAAQVVTSFNITKGDEKELKEAVAFAGPVSITFQVVGDFRGYASGVYTSPTCGNRPEDVNHAVLAVGYGRDSATGKDYWIVKNSWGPTWGDQGYFKIERGVNMCGVAVCNSYPLVKGEKVDDEEEEEKEEIASPEVAIA